eukprot:1305066-Rhodomonas_salina.3
MLAIADTAWQSTPTSRSGTRHRWTTCSSCSTMRPPQRRHCFLFNADISRRDASAVTELWQMFRSASALKKDAWQNMAPMLVTDTQSQSRC